MILIFNDFFLNLSYKPTTSNVLYLLRIFLVKKYLKYISIQTKISCIITAMFYFIWFMENKYKTVDKILQHSLFHFKKI